MKEFKGTKGNWQMIFHLNVCEGVGIVKQLDCGKYTEFVCNSLLPETDEEYMEQKEQIEADMKLIAAAPKMLQALIEISEGKMTNEDIIKLAKKVINKAL